MIIDELIVYFAAMYIARKVNKTVKRKQEEDKTQPPL